MEKKDLEGLFATAKEASKGSYSPYSKFPVGAALLLEDGTVITGANIENRSFGLTNCAERTAIFAAVAAGRKDFKAIAIATPTSSYPVAPCGACRQVISEFASPDTPVIFGSDFENSVFTDVKGVYPFDSLHDLGK
ncbi:MAG: cytidine deaminase [Treponema sp.]